MNNVFPFHLIGGAWKGLYLGLSWMELGGVGLARLHFWLQSADFGLFR